MSQAFDTMAYADDLERRGFRPLAAKALAEATRDHVVNRVATRDDIEVSARETRAELKLWIGGSMIAAVVATAAIAGLIVAAIK